MSAAPESPVALPRPSARVLPEEERTDREPAIEAVDEGERVGGAPQILVLCGAADLRQFLRRLVFTALAGNADAHLKNWSLIYSDGRSPRLSPAYDQVATIAYPGIADHLALPFLGALDFAAVHRQNLRRLGERLGVDGDAIEAEAVADAAVIMEEYRRAPFPAEARYRLDAHHQRLRQGPHSLLA